MKTQEFKEVLLQVLELQLEYQFALSDNCEEN